MQFYRKFSFWTLVVVLLLAAFFVYKKASVAIEVKTERAVRQRLDITVTATSTGTIKSDEDIKVTAQRLGRVSRLYVEEGDEVKAEGPIAELDTSEARLSLDMSRAALQKSRAYLQQLKAAYGAFEVEVNTSINSAKARLDDVEERYRNNRELLEKGFISQMEYTELESQYRVARAEYESALAGQQTMKAKKQEIEAQEASVKEARSNFELSKLNYQYSFINAPSSGVITSRPVELGQTVMKGELVAEMITTGSLYIEAFVDEADVGRVKLGQQVIVTMDAYPGKTLEGEVYRISPVVLGGRLENRTFEVRTRLLDAGVVLKTGMSADIEIVVQHVDDALVIPTQAVVESPDVKHVFMVDEGRAVRREIEAGLSDWTYTQVLSGLSKGDEVIITPDVPGLKDGVRIQVRGADD
jgi:HlyD family secretion protein